MPTWPITTIKELLEPTLNHMGYELYSLDQSGQSGRTLRISIDHNEPITIEDCERVSRVAGPLLDRSKLIDGRYDLEVSSPGAERPLRSHQEYERFNGRRVNGHTGAVIRRRWWKGSWSPWIPRASPCRRPVREGARR